MMLPGLPRSAVGQKNKNWIYFLDFLEWEWWNTREILNVGNSRWLVIFKERTIKELSTVFQNTCTDTTQFTNNKNRQLNEHFKIHSENHWLVFVCVFFFLLRRGPRAVSWPVYRPPPPLRKTRFLRFFLRGGGGSVHRQSVSLFSFPSLARFARRTKKKKTTLCLTKAVSTGKDNLYFACRRKNGPKNSMWPTP